MKNYTFGWSLKEKGWVEMPEENYTKAQREMQAYISLLSEPIAQGNCGWDGVRYVVLTHPDGYTAPYMVLYVHDGGSRWIPIDENSKGCCFSVLGENLW
jgi:hypothetical protein